MERHNALGTTGRTLSCMQGVWTIAAIGATVGTDPISGQVWNFSSDLARNSAKTFPGRFAILRNITLPNDSGDFYNQFRVEGKKDPNGNAIIVEQLIAESLTTPPDIRYLGRLKAYPEVRDEGLRTLSDCWAVVFSLIALYGRSCRFGAFPSYLHPALTVGTIIQIDGGKLAEVTRVSGASTKADRCEIAYMRLN
jgi:hypothetical protein